MQTSRDKLDSLLAIDDREELRRASLVAGLHMDTGQAHRLVDHLLAMEPPLAPYRLGIVHTYTSDLLDPWLKLCFALQGLDCDIYHAPYGVTIQETHKDSGLVAHAPEMTLLMLQKEDLHPALSQPVSSLNPEDLETVRKEAIDRLCKLVEQFRGAVDGQVLVSILPSGSSPGLGWYDAQSGRSEALWWAQLKNDAALWLRDSLAGAFFVDMDELVLRCGRSHFFDARFWYSARFPFTPEGATLFADILSSLAATNSLVKAKVIVLDADNTLWGGVVGEEGVSGISLGPDYPGNAYLDFQKRILDFQQRGFLLALCSKNNIEDVQQVFDNHPHQILKNEHFAAQRINWLPKSENIRSMAEELNLGLNSFIFVDDSSHECAEVKHNLHEVDVIQVPGKVIDIPRCLDKFPRLEIVSLTAEDMNKTRMYAQERLRQDLKQSFTEGSSGIDDYLESLNMHMVVGMNDPNHVKRMSQLTQKTNQYNLTTRRYKESDIQDYIQDESWQVFHFSLSDSFGDSGLVGLALICTTGEESAQLDTFLMSCRVIGRRAEVAFLGTIIDYLRANNVNHLHAEYLPTAKNQPVKNLLPDNGFIANSEGHYVLDIDTLNQQRNEKLPITVSKDF